MRKVMLMLFLWAVCWAASAQSNPPINLLKLSGEYICRASDEPQEIADIRSQARGKDEQPSETQTQARGADEQPSETQTQDEAQDEAQPKPAPSQAESVTESKEASGQEIQERPKPPPSRRLTVRMLVQSAGYPVINLENEFLQISGRAVQMVHKANRDVAFILNGGGLGSFALHIAQAKGPVTAKLWRIDQETFTTALYRYDCVKR